MSDNKYVYVVSKDFMQVIDTAKSEEDLRKRIPRKKTPYPKDVIFVRVERNRVLHCIETDEYEDASVINDALTAAIVAGVDFDTAIQRLVDKNVISVFTVESKKEPTEA